MTKETPIPHEEENFEDSLLLKEASRSWAKKLVDSAKEKIRQTDASDKLINLSKEKLKDISGSIIKKAISKHGKRKS
tara:strand:- start:1639 stop:1869 length:231 start_codon:yes stop_codon:yes gene_type:complete